MAVLIKSGNSLVPVGNSFSLAQGISDDDVIQHTASNFSGSYINNTISYIAPAALTKYLSLTDVFCTNCQVIDRYAFASCTSLTTVSFPICTKISSHAFR